MKLYIYEFYKLIRSKYVISIIVVLTVICGVLGIWTINQRKDIVTPELLNEIYDEYFSNPTELDEKYSDWVKTYNAYSSAYSEYAKHGGIEPTIPPHSYSPYFSDKQIYDKLYYDVWRNAEYHDAIADVIKNAGSIMLSMERSGSTDSFTYSYQRQVSGIYSRLFADVYIGFENTRGWDVYLTADFPFLLALFGCVLTVAFFYTTERQSGCYHIMRTTKRGRSQICAAKILAALTTESCLIIIFQLIWFTTVRLGIGFGSPYNGIQAYEAFTYCPFDLTVLQYSLADLFMKWIAVTAFSAVCMLISAVSEYIGSLVVNIILLSGNFALYSFSSQAPETALHLTGLIFVGKESMLRYHALNIAGNSLSLWSVIIPFLLIFAVGLFALSSNIYMKRTVVMLRIRLKLPTAKMISMEKLEIHKSNAHNSLLCFELEKYFKNRTSLIFTIFYMISSIVIFNYSLGVLSSDDEKLRDYIDSGLYGEISEAKFVSVADEGYRLETANELYNANVDGFYRGQLTLDKFKPIADEKAYADSRENAYRMLSEYSGYLESQSSDRRPWFVFEKGFDRLFSDANDYLLILLCCYAGSAIAGAEYRSSDGNGGFYPILSTLKRGRRPVFFAKFECSALISVVMCVFSYVVRLMIIAKTYGLRGLGAPLYSLADFGEHPFAGLAIGWYLMLHLMYSLLLPTALCTASAAFSILLKKAFPAFIITVSVALLPVAFSGLKLPDFICIYRLMNLSNLDCLMNIFGLIFTLLILLWVCIHAYRLFCLEKIRRRILK